jgi:hypothetical protein
MMQKKLAFLFRVKKALSLKNTMDGRILKFTRENFFYFWQKPVLYTIVRESMQ